jgi:hypothetical protein
MGTSLLGLKPKNTYQGLLKTSDNTAINATTKFLSDGLGNDSALSLSTSAIGVGGLINATGFSHRIRVIGTFDASIGIFRNQASGSPAKLEFMKSRGTYDVPLTVNANDQLGNISFFGYYGTNYGGGTAINSTAVSTSATGVEGTMKFVVYNNTGSNFDKLGIYKEGVYVGDTVAVPTSQLQIRGKGATSATTSLLVQNSASTQIFKVTDDASFTFAAGGTTDFFGNVSLRGVNDSGNVANNLRFIVPGSTKSFLINADYSNTNAPSAMLEVQSTTKGFLPPRMTDAQARAIVTPAEGLVVYNTTISHLCCYQGGAWVKFNHSPM